MTTSTARVPVTSVAASDLPRLVAAANALVAGNKGLLAIDESIPTCNKRFARLGIAQTVSRRGPQRRPGGARDDLANGRTGVRLADEARTLK
ncbi:class I fructose-bisphosphate aldolase [Mycobacterium sp.]|uniref:class I fructose-bisphosphate aldolase n=1 Tax=Mycobacterium sp. TaxID=1785 RepID=UPI003C75ECD4